MTEIGSAVLISATEFHTEFLRAVRIDHDNPFFLSILLWNPHVTGCASQGNLRINCSSPVLQANYPVRYSPCKSPYRSLLIPGSRTTSRAGSRLSWRGASSGEVRKRDTSPEPDESRRRPTGRFRGRCEYLQPVC